MNHCKSSIVWCTKLKIWPLCSHVTDIVTEARYDPLAFSPLIGEMIATVLFLPRLSNVVFPTAAVAHSTASAPASRLVDAILLLASSRSSASRLSNARRRPSVMSSFLQLPLATRVGTVSALILAVGLALGLALDANAHIPDPWNRVSSIIGWVYFMCWSVSFYPQVFLNHARKSVVGLSLDYTVLNFLGFTCYTVFNCAFYYSESVQEQYMRRNDGHRNAVELNDVFFAIHAAVLVAVSLVQCAIYPRGGQTVSTATIAWATGAVVVATFFGLVVAATGNREDSLFNTLNLLYLLSYVKLMTTLVKCIPQIVLNYQRKSTVGWTIWNVLLDIAGGLLSIGQQVLDSAATSDWTAITGNPVKFSLGFVSIVVDIVFILQHYVWYATSSDHYLSLDETKPFLP